MSYYYYNYYNRHVRMTLTLLFLFLGINIMNINNIILTPVMGISCDPVEGYYLPSGEDYRGNINITESGIPCQAWTSQFPHHHDTIVPNIFTGIGNHNYCRNPSGLERVGCFTLDASIRFQFCNIGLPCNFTPQEFILYFTPKSGTQLTFHNSLVTIACYPRPCKIYYTLDNTNPTITKSLIYTRPIVLEKNTTIKALSVFNFNKTLRRQAFYALPNLPPTPIAYFSPTTTEIYNTPVLIVMRGLKKNDTVLIFKNKELIGNIYDGPFWLNESTNLTAVLNEKVTIKAHYIINVTGKPVEVYPPSGKYIGGISCLIYQSNSQTNYKISINNSEWQSLHKLFFIIDKVGKTSVAVKAIYLGGVESITLRTYDIMEASLPLLIPSPNIVYNHPINISCMDPKNKLLALGENNEKESFFSIYINKPGKFPINCSYIDDLHQIKSTNVIYELQSISLPIPLLFPECERQFPMTPIILNASAVLPNNNNNNNNKEKESSKLILIANVTGGTLQKLSNKNLYVLEVSKNSTPINTTIILQSYSSHPLEGESPLLICQYKFLPLETSTTPWFMGYLNCGDSIECINSLKNEIANCLLFYKTELIFTKMIGPFVLLRLNNLPNLLKDEYYERVGKCLINSSLNNIRNETSGLMQIAFSWSIKNSLLQTEIFTGMEVIIIVEGWGLEYNEFHLVRSEYTCDDIGISYNNRISVSNFTTHIAFIIDTPGVYTLCAMINNNNNIFYRVPSDNILLVKPKVLPLLSVTPCGGPVENFLTTNVVIANIIPKNIYSNIFYSINTDMWVKEKSDTRIYISQFKNTSSSSVLAVTSGKSNGASLTCVFYSPLKDIPKLLTYNWSIISRFNDVSNILIAINGSFSEDVRVEFKVYNPQERINNVSYNNNNNNKSMIENYLNETPIFTSLGTSIENFAVADHLFSIKANTKENPFHIVTVIDNISLNVEPLSLALSPLAISMFKCNNCTSGWCFNNKCVCIGELNYSAYFCNEQPLPPKPSDTTSTRSLFLFAYLILIILVCVSVGVAITRGKRRRVYKQEGNNAI